MAFDFATTNFSLYADDEWDTQYPDSDGFTDLGPNNRTFTVSMIHQIHCLDVFRVGFVTNRTHMAEHIEHCLRYMRLVVLCHGDTTLEEAEPGFRNGKWVYVTSTGGLGAVHRCKDWTAIRQYLDEHPAHPAQPPVET